MVLVFALYLSMLSDARLIIYILLFTAIVWFDMVVRVEDAILGKCRPPQPKLLVNASALLWTTARTKA